jgi:hypothetical protein
MWVVKINSSGDVLFSKTIGGSDDEAAYGVVQTIDLGYALAGETKTDMIAGVANKGGFDGYLVKVNNSGSTVFQKLVGGSADDGFKAITQTASGELYLAGSTLSNDYDISGNKGGSDYLIARYKSNGTRMWAKTYGGTTNDNAHSITMYGRTPVIAGETESNNGDVPGNKGGDDFWVLRIKATGVTMFSKTFGGETADIARSIVRVPDGFIVAGESESNSMDVNGNYGSSDYWFVKLNNSGNLVYEQNYGGADKDIAYAVARKSDGNFLIAGSSESDNVDVTDNNGNADYWVAYLDNPSARVASSVTEESNAATMFPNPTVGMVTITSATEMTDVVVYDLNGRALISTPVDQFQANIDLSSFPNGIYLAKVMMADGSQQITRIIKN